MIGQLTLNWFSKKKYVDGSTDKPNMAKYSQLLNQGKGCMSVLRTAL